MPVETARPAWERAPGGWRRCVAVPRAAARGRPRAGRRRRRRDPRSLARGRRREARPTVAAPVASRGLGGVEAVQEALSEWLRRRSPRTSRRARPPRLRRIRGCFPASRSTGPVLLPRPLVALVARVRGAAAFRRPRSPSCRWGAEVVRSGQAARRPPPPREALAQERPARRGRSAGSRTTGSRSRRPAARPRGRSSLPRGTSTAPQLPTVAPRGRRRRSSTSRPATPSKPYVKVGEVELEQRLVRRRAHTRPRRGRAPRAGPPRRWTRARRPACPARCAARIRCEIGHIVEHERVIEIRRCPRAAVICRDLAARRPRTSAPASEG